MSGPRLNRLTVCSRPRFGWLRMFVGFLLAMSLSGLAHGAEEAVETLVHVAGTGHAAHADHHPEGERATTGQEHFCFGTVHNCGCCPTAVAAGTADRVVAGSRVGHLGHDRFDDDAPLEGVRERVDRPPRA